VVLITGIGQIFHRGEYWMLLYDSCGHVQYFARTSDRLYGQVDVGAAVRRFYATCGMCAWAPIATRSSEEFTP
jgi:hypothetical protein